MTDPPIVRFADPLFRSRQIAAETFVDSVFSSFQHFVPEFFTTRALAERSSSTSRKTIKLKNFVGLIPLR